MLEVNAASNVADPWPARLTDLIPAGD